MRKLIIKEWNEFGDAKVELVKITPPDEVEAKAKRLSLMRKPLKDRSSFLQRQAPKHLLRLLESRQEWFKKKL